MFPSLHLIPVCCVLNPDARCGVKTLTSVDVFLGLAET